MNNIIKLKPQKSGIFSGISNNDYHSDKNSFSSSIIKLMEIPAMAKHSIDSPSEFKDCYRIGTAIHTKLLEPNLFDDQFFTGINVPRRSNDNKSEWASFFIGKGADGYLIIDKPAAKWYAEFEKQTGKSILSPDELKSINDMAESVKNNTLAMELLMNGEPEQSIYWTDQETGLNLRVRPDFLNHTISDLKSVQSAKPQFFAKKAFDLGYHISQAMYQDGVFQATGKFKRFKFITVEKTAPYLCAVHEFDEESAEEGYNQYREYLGKLANCLDSGEWPGIQNNDGLSLPRYAFKEYELGLVLDGVSI